MRAVDWVLMNNSVSNVLQIMLLLERYPQHNQGDLAVTGMNGLTINKWHSDGME